MQCHPAGTISRHGLTTNAFQGVLKQRWLPSKPMETGLELLVIISGKSIDTKTLQRSIGLLKQGSDQDHLPAVVHPWTQLTEAVRCALRQERPLEQGSASCSGTRPVFVHPVEDHPVEIENEERL